MPNATRRPPKLRHHRASNRDYVVFPGSTPTYLGRHGSQRGLQEYHRLVAKWIEGGCVRVTPAATSESNVRVKDVVLAFMTHAVNHYRRADGTQTGEEESCRQVGRLLISLFGEDPAASFGPLKLRAAREWMIRGGWSYRSPTHPDDPERRGVARAWVRTSINRNVRRIRTMFKWAASMELIPPSVPAGLATVAGLRQGRTEAAESEPVKPVAESHVQPTLAHMSPQVRAMVELQLLTGMRPGEVIAMRGREIDASGTVWVYRPSQHKNTHRDHERAVMIGPKARAIVERWLRTEIDAPLFSPAEAEQWRRAKLTASRQTPLSCGNKPGSKRKRAPQRKPRDAYTVASYARAIRRTCELAYPAPAGLRADKVKQWNRDHRYTPHQLRHTAGTRFRRQHGLEAAQVLLGHRHAAITEMYAESNVEKAAEVAALVG